MPESNGGMTLTEQRELEKRATQGAALDAELRKDRK